MRADRNVEKRVLELFKAPRITDLEFEQHKKDLGGRGLIMSASIMNPKRRNLLSGRDLAAGAGVEARREEQEQG